MSTLSPDKVSGYLVDGDIDAVAKRHPWRWVSAAAVAGSIFLFAYILATAPAMKWDIVSGNLFSSNVLGGVRNTLVMTVLAMAIGMVLGTTIAVMRLSSNAVLVTVASLYQWFFRGTPTLVQLIFWFNIASIVPRLNVTIFGVQLVNIDFNQVMTPFVAALLGLGLNFSAYYSEVVRAGIMSVDEGQTDSATAYGASRYQTLRHIVLPQAMRVIIPPTGNELIGMLKWTSIASVVAYSELLRSVQNVYARTFDVIPMLTVAAIWYLAMTTVLTVGQHFLERRFARGTQRGAPPTIMTRLGNNIRGRRAKL